MPPIPDNPALTGREKRIAGILASLGETKDICKAASLIQGMDSGADQEIARLFMAHTLSGINRDDLNASQESLRRKICEQLGVGDHFKGDIRKGGGKYGKGELESVEFKSSYVFYNKDGKPDLFKQGRGQVLEAVCGFMNKDGGTVYVGVSTEKGEYAVRLMLLGDRKRVRLLASSFAISAAMKALKS